jgi:hypothetical protein
VESGEHRRLRLTAPKDVNSRSELRYWSFPQRTYGGPRGDAIILLREAQHTLAEDIPLLDVNTLAFSHSS